MKAFARIVTASTLTVGLLLGAGCVERVVYTSPPVVVQQPSQTVVTEAPPPPQVEVIAPAPGPEYVWVPGCWDWHGRWVWITGRGLFVPTHEPCGCPGRGSEIGRASCREG